MTLFYEKIFTDVVKDVIGNDPVLDQFDISYAASFYGTLQDSYITGTILYDVTKFYPGSTKRIFLTGSRGEAFNKIDANSQQPLSDVYGSTDVQNVPRLSYRLIPWKDRVSNVYRTTQCFDSSERFYDSCLPDVENAFLVDGSSVWTISDNPSFFLSPYANVQSSSIGYLMFNSLKSNRTSQGFNNDPLVNNTWTWSYPYENRYSPQNRITFLDKNIIFRSSISTTTSSFSETPDAKTSYESIVQSLVNYPSFFSSYFDKLGFNLLDRVVLDKVQPTFKNISNLNFSKKIDGFIPLLPGRHNSEILGPQGRNSLRYFISVTGSLGKVSVPMSMFNDPSLDSNFGLSMVIPSDVNLGSLISHSYLPSQISAPSDEHLTGTMSYADSIRFLFGFGDLNNMTYGERQFIKENATLSYFEGFESYSNGTRAYNVSSYTTDPSLIVRWNQSTSDGSPPQVWQVIESNGTANYLGENTSFYYNYVSGTTAGSPSALTSGLAWLSSSSPSNRFILMTSGSVDLKGDPVYGYYNTTSIASVVITSSYPWTFSYDRAVAGHSSDGLFVYFTDTPGNSDTFPTLTIPIEFVRGKATTANTDTLVKMEKFDLRTSVSKDEYPRWVQQAYGVMSGSTYDYPLPPGNWKLNFVYAKSGTISEELVANQDVAAIDNFQIFTWREDAFPPVSGSTIGANNYPNFRATKLDNRFNPIAPGFDNSLLGTGLNLNKDVVTGSADFYKGCAFGISPIIRGWKYGLISGFPMNSRAVFRRDKFGQFRDMLEQRQYSKFVSVDYSPMDGSAIISGDQSTIDGDPIIGTGQVRQIGSSPVTVNFVKQTYSKDDRGIGDIYNKNVPPNYTYSQNMSNEVTSSLPYFDGVARHRTDEEILLVKNLAM